MLFSFVLGQICQAAVTPMEGTLDDTLVKDPSQDDADKLLKGMTLRI